MPAVREEQVMRGGCTSRPAAGDALLLPQYARMATLNGGSEKTYDPPTTGTDSST